MRKDSPLLNYYYKKLPKAQTGLNIPGVTDFVMPRAVSASTSAGVPKRNAEVNDQIIARKQNETYKQLINAGMDERSARTQSRSGVKMLPSTQKMLDAQKQREYRTQMSQGYDPSKPVESQTYLADNNSIWSNLYRGKNMVMDQDMGPIGNFVKPFTFGVGANFVNTAEHIGSPYESYVQPGFMGALNNLAGDVMAVYPNLPIRGAQALNYGVQGIRGIPASLRGMNNMFNSTGELAESSFTTPPTEKAPPIDFNARNARVKQFWAEKQANKAGVTNAPTTADEYRKMLQQQKLQFQAGDFLRREGQPDPSIGGWSPINNPETNRMVGLAQYGKPQQLNNLDFVTNEQLINERIFEGEFNKHVKDYMNMGYDASDAVEKATHKTLDILKDHPDFDYTLGLERTLQRLTRGPNSYNPFSKDFRPEFLKSQKPLGSQAKGVLRKSYGTTDPNFSVTDPNIKVLGDQAALSNETGLRPELISMRKNAAGEFIPSKILNIYQKQLPSALENLNLQPYTGTKAFNTLTPNKYGGLAKFTNGGNVSVGQEMTVTTKQLEELRRQGYKIKML